MGLMSKHLMSLLTINVNYYHQAVLISLGIGPTNATVSTVMKELKLMTVMALSIKRSVKRLLIPAKPVNVTATWSGVLAAICLQTVGRKPRLKLMVLTLRYLKISFILDIMNSQLLSKETLRLMLQSKLVLGWNGLGVFQLRKLLTKSLLFVTRLVSKAGLRFKVIDWLVRLKLWVVLKTVQMMKEFESRKMVKVFFILSVCG